jgi:aspartate carbamoyltransferase regulatory subunit
MTFQEEFIASVVCVNPECTSKGKGYVRFPFRLNELDYFKKHWIGMHCSVCNQEFQVDYTRGCWIRNSYARNWE